jgi:hypothetical protein
MSDKIREAFENIESDICVENSGLGEIRSMGQKWLGTKGIVAAIVLRKNKWEKISNC